jgi:hypothetical protein
VIVSQPDSRPASGRRGVHGEKPQANIFTALLLVALLALLLASLFLILEIKYQKAGQKFFDPVRPVKVFRLPPQPQHV